VKAEHWHIPRSETRTKLAFFFPKACRWKTRDILHGTPLLPVVENCEVYVDMIMTIEFTCFLIFFAVGEPSCQFDGRLSKRANDRVEAVETVKLNGLGCKSAPRYLAMHATFVGIPRG